MGILKHFRKKNGKLFVLGLDGTPYSFVLQQIKKGKFPNFQHLIEKGAFKRMNSVIPCISSVAWTTYMTGVNPAKHNIHGFVDRKPNPFEIYIPTARNLASKTLFEMLSEARKQIISINVPVTYPPREVNGIQISGFLATDLAKAVYPNHYYQKLKDLGYRIDVDAWQGRKDKEKFLEDIHYTFDKRVETAFRLMESESWDFFQLHVMETDRINHFLWEQWETGHSKYAQEFEKFYQKIDWLVGEMDSRLDEGVSYLVLSDHGFCSIKKEVYLNQWLEKNGYLKYNTENPKSVADMRPDSKAYSLIPGRIFVNLKGREAKGSIAPGSEYENLRNELIEALPTITNPDDSEKIIERVYKREELYSGPYFDRTPDLVAVSYNGYDLKGNINQEKLTYKSDLVGMHTYADAFIYIRNMQIERDGFGIIDVTPTVLKLMGVVNDYDFDGDSLVRAGV